MIQGKNLLQATLELDSQSKSKEEINILAAQKMILGNRSSNTLYFDKSIPKTIVELIAPYGHKVFVQGQVWGINSSDQWGVELGRQSGDKVYSVLLAEEASLENDFDSSTKGMIDAFRSMDHKL